MLKPFIAMLAVTPLFAVADAVPRSVELWLNQDEYFWGLDFSSETGVKQQLTDYYRQTLQGEEFEKYRLWIEQGNLESEYFSAYFGELQDQTVQSVIANADNHYEIRVLQSSCYLMDYNAPKTESLVADFKITNLTQAEVDQWVQDQGFPPSGEICMEIIEGTYLQLDPQTQLITDTRWERLESTAELISEL